MRKKLLYGSALALILSGYPLQAQTQIGSEIKGPGAQYLFGTSVSMSSNGKIMAVGAPQNYSTESTKGQVIIYNNTNGVWTPIGKPINGEYTNDRSGSSISLSGDGTTVAIGATENAGNGFAAGHVRIYQNINNVWTQIGSDIDGEAKDRSGYSVSISADGSIVAIGAKDNSNDNGLYSGHVRIYQNISGSWTQIGSDINGSSSNNAFGSSVSLSADGTVVAIGAPFAYGEGSNTGQVKIYKNTGGDWTKIGSPINGTVNDYMSGFSVSLSADGTTVAVGAPRNDGKDGSPFNGGHIRVFKNISGIWSQIGPDFQGSFADSLGWSISISADGSVLAMSTSWRSGDSSSNLGLVKIYQNILDSWKQIGNDIYGQTSDEFSGKAISISGDGKTLSISASTNDANGIDSGNVRVFDISSVLTLSSDQFVMERTSIYPNPVKNELHIQLTDNLNLQEVNIYSILGQLIQTEKTNQINVSSLAKGFYMVQVVTNKGITTQKVLLD